LNCSLKKNSALKRKQRYKEKVKIMEKIFNEIKKERQQQDEKWGEQNHHAIEWCAILGEEVGEVNKAALEAHFKGYKRTGNYSDYRTELIQVAAVAVAMIECLDRGL
jgi:NTP pyrophosphatase (non-canonical NTP hydrolase)